MLSFYNIMCHSKSVKRAASLSIDGIKTKQIFFVPMLARHLTLDEANKYDSLTTEEVERIRANPEVLDF